MVWILNRKLLYPKPPAMELYILIALIVIVILLFNIRSSQKESAERNAKQFNALRKEILELKKEFASKVISQTSEPAPGKSLSPTDESVIQWRPYVLQPVVEKSKEESITEKISEEKEEPPATVSPINAAVSSQSFKHVVPSEPKESWWDKFVRNNPDFEKFIGENLANKIGIAVLVLGIAFFVKYAIDQNWIKETGRVAIGIGCGIIMIGIAHYLRNTYRSFSSVMAGGAIAVFYFTIAFAFHEYQLFTQTTAFIIMIVITAFAVALSLLYNKLELAVIATVGGFLVPFMVSTGQGNYIVLFTYLIILNVGILCISYFKKWPLLHVLSFFFTLIIYSGWLLQQLLFKSSQLPYKNALLFASIFYLLFLAITLIHNLRTKIPFKGFQFSLMLLITFSFYAQGMLILGEWTDGKYQGIFTMIMSIINLVLAWYLYKAQKGEKNLLYLLIGLTLTFLSLTAPVQLKGHNITLFWAAETVLLYWLHQRSKIVLFKYSSVIVFALLFISLMMDWVIANDQSTTLPLLFNDWKGIVTNLTVIISLGLYAYLLLKPDDDNHFLFTITKKMAASFMATLSAAILYLTCIFTVNWHFAALSSFIIPNVYHQIITYLFIAVGLIVIKKIKAFDNPVLQTILILAGFLFFIASSLLSGKLVNAVVENRFAGGHLYMHWLADVLLLYLLYQLIVIVRNNPNKFGYAFTWLTAVLFVLFFSIECGRLYVYELADAKSLSTYQQQYQKAGLTIVWAVLSFAMMWLGMRHKYKTLRIISLSFFTLALLKLFLYDISNISAGGKIAAFIMLGVLLLVISFMYQRLKKIIIDNEEKTA